MERCDAYNRDGTPAGRDLVRGWKIPKDLYHLVCEVLVCHRDGSYLLMQRDWSKATYPGRLEATAGGSALKGEDPLTCVRRELWEETGVCGEDFEPVNISVYEKEHIIFHSFVCRTDCDKSAVRLQQGETIAFRWLNEEEFLEFLASDQGIARQKERFEPYFRMKGYL